MMRGLMLKIWSTIATASNSEDSTRRVLQSKSATRRLQALSDHWQTAYNLRRVSEFLEASKHCPRLRLRRLKFLIRRMHARCC